MKYPLPKINKDVYKKSTDIFSCSQLPLQNQNPGMTTL